MRIITAALALGIFQSVVMAQAKFEKGYLIEEGGDRTLCFIKNQDWKNNPTQFKYQLELDGEVLTGSLDQVREFGIGSSVRYVRATVELDRSKSDLKNLSLQRAPEFETETLFLKVVIEGEATLYRYEERNLKRYFFKIGSDEIQQLVYKQYNYNGVIKENNYYYQQLLVLQESCSSISEQVIQDTEYKERAFRNLFIMYNTCVDVAYSEYGTNANFSSININLVPAIGIANFDLSSGRVVDRDFTMNGKVIWRIGAELEAVLSSNNDRIAIIMEPRFQFYEASDEKDDKALELTYNSFQLTLGARYYFPVNEDSRFFVNAAGLIDVPLGDPQMKFDFPVRNSVIVDEFGMIPNIVLGGGYKYKDRLGLGVQFIPSIDLLSESAFYRSNVGIFSLQFMYTLVKL